MTIISSIVDKYSKKYNNIIYDTKYIDIILSILNHRFIFTHIDDINIFTAYRYCILDNNLSNIDTLFRQYLCKFIVIDDNDYSSASLDHWKKLEILYNDYRAKYNIKFITFNAEDVLKYGIIIHDRYMNIKQLGELIDE